MLSKLSALPILLLAASCATFQRGPNPEDLMDPAGPAMNMEAPPIYHANFQTTEGDFVIEVNREWAPRGSDRFFNLVRHGYYDGAHFFRVVDGFVVQFGLPADPALADIWTTQRIDDDPVTQDNLPGYISFASAGANTRTTQVFINLGDNRRLDNLGFAPFGRVIEGMEVVESLFSGYGEGVPQGRGPSQDRIQEEGAVYLNRDFPDLDSIITASITVP